MQYDLQIEDISPIRRRLRFTVPAALVKSELDTAYASLKTRARLPGFRPGKAPRNVLEARYGRQVQSDVGSKLIDRAFRAAAGDLELAGQPTLEEQGELKSGVDLTFVIGVDVKPSLELSGYTGLDVQYAAASVQEVDIDNAVRRLVQGQSKIVDVAEDRPVQAGDRVLARIELKEGDTVLAEEAGTMVLTTGERYYPGLETLLLGMSKGQDKVGTVTIAASSQYAQIAGKELQASVSVLGMQALRVPELDDALATELGYEGGVDAMRAAIAMRLQEQVDEQSRTQARVALLQKLVDANRFDVPPAMVEEQLEALVEELKVRRTWQGQDPRSVRFSDAEMADLRTRALFAARASVILAGVARQEKIEVSNADLDAKIEEIAGSRGQSAEQIRAYLQRENAFPVLRIRILEEKTLEWLLEQANLVAVDSHADAPATEGTATAAAPAAKAPAAPAAAAAAPTWNKSMKKDELLAVALQLGLAATAKMKKDEIIALLETA